MDMLSKEGADLYPKRCKLLSNLAIMFRFALPDSIFYVRVAESIGDVVIQSILPYHVSRQIGDTWPEF